MLSMTGYGFSEEIYDGYQVSVEVKSLNNRFLDINIKLPYVINNYDSAIRNITKKYAKRGKIDILITLVETSHDFEIKPDLILSERYYDTFDAILKHLKDKGLRDNVRLFNLINAEGIINVNEKHNAEKIWTGTEQQLIKALEQLVVSKEKEGYETKSDLQKIITYMENQLKEIKKYSEESITKYEEKLRKKITDLLEEKKIDEERVLQEVAIMSSKVDINEEINRLSSHIQFFRNTLEEEESVGRRLDFISQEINREINTIGSKSLHIGVSNIIINMKTELEKLKEQIRNIE